MTLLPRLSWSPLPLSRVKILTDQPHISSTNKISISLYEIQLSFKNSISNSLIFLKNKIDLNFIVFYKIVKHVLHK
jgi:hypothetical protein